jgi:cytochrome P450
VVHPFTNIQHRLGPAPIVRAEAPAGGPVWVITDEALAKRVLADPRITRDSAYAPTHWQPWELGVEPPGAQVPSLTTLDGPPHLRLRRAHAPLFTSRRIAEHADRTTETARRLLSDTQTDLVADFTTRFPLTVICELLGVPTEHLDELAEACHALTTSVGPAAIGAATATLSRLVASALDNGDTAAAQLRARLPELTDEQVHYLLFGLVFAGQLTTESALGFLIAHLLAGHHEGSDDEFVQEMLRRNPPAPFTLWRFTTEEVELAGTVLPPRSPVLAHIQGINDAGHDLTFGFGAHFCIGAQLAQQELVAVTKVLREDYPAARLAVPFDELEVVDLGINGRRLTALPVVLQ